MADDDRFTRDDHATWGIRLGAWLLDIVVFAIAASVSLVVLSIAGASSVQFSSRGDNTRELVVLVLAIIVWDVLWISGPPRGKPGHLLLGIRIATPDGGRVPVPRSIVRSLVRSVNLVFCGLEAVASAATIAATPRRQALHDLVAGTVAVRAEARARVAGMPPPASTPPPPASPAGRPSRGDPFGDAGDDPPQGGPFV